MRVSTSRLLATALAALAAAGAAQAQPMRGFYNGTPQPIPITGINPNFRIAPNLTLSQYAFNTAVLGRAYAQVPPYVFGYNPYPQVQNFGPSYPTLSNGYNPYAVNPYGYGGGYGSPYLGAGGYAPGGATLSTTGYGGGATLDPSSGYGGGYGSPYVPYADPYGGTLHGVADLTNATGRYLNQVQEARSKKSQADIAQLDVNRRIWEEAEWERKHTPRSEDVRLFEQKEALSRALMNPPDNEIWTGKSLNDIYMNVKDRQGALLTSGGRLPTVKVDPELLKKINLTTGAGGNVGLLKNDLDRDLNWPLTLRDDVFKKEREELTEKMKYAVSQIKNEKGKVVGAATLSDIKAALDALHLKLATKSVRDLTPSESIEAKRFLYQLDAAYKALQDPNVANYFSEDWKLKGDTVAQVVDMLTQKGIRFAPGTQGTEDAYRAMHSALVAYYSALPQTVSTTPK
jgi:hypothetical protein